MNTIAERLFQIREVELRMTQQEFARKAGVSQATIGNIEAGTRKEPRKLLQIAEAAGVNPEWLQNGTGPKYPNPQQSVQDTFQDSGEYDFVTRVTDANLSAGSGAILWDFDEIENSHSFRREWMQQHRLRADKCKVWSVVGPSMEPTVNGGDVVLINMADREPKHGKVFALVCEDGLRLKRLVKNDQGRWIMRSDNADKRVYPDEPITDDGCAIIGVAVWRGGGVL